MRQKNPNYQTASEWSLASGRHFQTMPNIHHTSLWLIRLLAACPVMLRSQAGNPA